MAKGVYLHIPFCHQICNYCDFNKVFFKNQPVDEYIEAVGKELEMLLERYPNDFQQVKTIFVGGGTPTALTPAQINRLLDLIKLYIPFDHLVEFTTEANPDELTEEKLEVLKQGGVNRLSLGVQSFHEQLLKQLGRTHSIKDVYKTIDDAKRIGFENISIDLMYGLPGQTMDVWEDTLNQALSLDLPHYSAYSLIVEPKTVFYIQYMKGKLQLPPEELEADMYGLLMEKMESRGRIQYEISNFAQQGFYSRHNKLYWDNEEYVGIGAGAHGYLNGIRYSNIAPINKYIQAVREKSLPILHEHLVTNEEKMEEEMFLGLRKNEGVSYVEFEKKTGAAMKEKYGDIIQRLTNQGLLMEEDFRVKLTKKGRFVGNEVFQQFLIGE